MFCSQSIQVGLRRALANVRANRIAPSSINAPPPNFIPPALGSAPSSTTTDDTSEGEDALGLQEARVERDAWKGVADALSKLKQLSSANSHVDVGSEDVSMG